MTLFERAKKTQKWIIIILIFSIGGGLLIYISQPTIDKEKLEFCLNPTIVSWSAPKSLSNIVKDCQQFRKEYRKKQLDEKIKLIKQRHKELFGEQ